MTDISPPAAQRPTRPALLWLVLILIGVAWGATGPFSKLSVSEGNHPVGITFWTSAISAVVLSAALWARGRRLPIDRRHVVFYLIVGFLGTALPNGLSYAAYQHLPVGVMMTVIALVPMATLLLALPLGIEQPEPRRLIGLALGVAAVALIALPDSSLPDPDKAVWIILPVIVTLAYAAESLYLAARRPPGCDTLTVMCGLCWGSVALLIPALVATGGWVDITRLGPPELAILYNTAIHLVAYFGFLWLITQAGPVFAVQVGYVVTGSGVGFGMLVYGERPSAWVWAALALMFAGLALVKPRR
jgi:drug/metabolite transporter (DMT)-like permease